ncbi:vacuolar protein-sorting-associated protein 36-like isoform X1 [Patiria miniata]|uniref:Vacuolar protein-sorting-associated protein 36 n=1 Tax=Patiria miniata TaxID=46514 RepID=A0A913ZX62_PATMI|nr:vacuolar protein-sorting-associated protein 36-like isoform X1 [Patiria miniata]
MDRFEWGNGNLLQGETQVKQQHGVRLHDGTDKTAFDRGIITLTSHRLIWTDSVQQTTLVTLPLSLVLYAEEVPAGRGKSPRVAFHLHPAPPNKPPGPVMMSAHSYIQLSFKEGGETEFFRCLSEELSRRRWEYMPTPKAAGKPKAIHAGIVGIERNLEKKWRDTDENISQAFEDLNKLMKKAKEMVDLSRTIANKIKDKQGSITEDETVQFKSYLLSLGIANPVTRETHGTGTKYHEELAKQLSDVLTKPIEESGGMMALSDVYCRINRARGMELLSPDDLVDACRQFEALRLPLRLRVFNSGVMVIELVSKGEEAIIRQTAELLNEKKTLSPDELSQSTGISILLAKGRLLAAEEAGQACRDESVEGIRFFPNLFLNPPTR